jgi:hypothetical protein
MDAKVKEKSWVEILLELKLNENEGAEPPLDKTNEKADSS